MTRVEGSIELLFAGENLSLEMKRTANTGIQNTISNSFQFEMTNCSFRFNANTCFSVANGGAGEETTSYTISAHNSGTDYISTPSTANITVYKYDVPNYVYEPTDANSGAANRVLSTELFYENKHLQAVPQLATVAPS